MFCDHHQKHVRHLSHSNGVVPRRQTVCNLQWFHRSSCEHACAWHSDVDLEMAIHICDTNELHDSRVLQHQIFQQKNNNKTIRIFTSRNLKHFKKNTDIISKTRHPRKTKTFHKKNTKPTKPRKRNNIIMKHGKERREMKKKVEKKKGMRMRAVTL